jgi:hypothetical protein
MIIKVWLFLIVWIKERELRNNIICILLSVNLYKISQCGADKNEKVIYLFSFGFKVPFESTEIADIRRFFRTHKTLKTFRIYQQNQN